MLACGFLLFRLLSLVFAAPVLVEHSRIQPVPVAGRYATKIIMPAKHIAYVVPVGSKSVVGGPVVTKTVYTPEFIKTIVLPAPNHALHPAVTDHGDGHTVIAHPDGKIYTLYGHRVNAVYAQGNARRFYGDAGTKVYVIYAYNSDGQPIYTAEDGQGHTLYAVKDEQGHVVYTLRGDGPPFYATEDGHVHIVSAPGGVQGHAVHSGGDGLGHTLYISRDSQGRTTIYKSGQGPSYSTPGGHGVPVYAVEGGQGHAVYTPQVGYDGGVAIPGHGQGRTVYTIKDGRVHATVYTSGQGLGPGVAAGGQGRDVYKIEANHGQTVYTSSDGHVLTISAPESQSGHAVHTAEEDNIHTLFVTGGHEGAGGGQGHPVYTIDRPDGRLVPVPQDGHGPKVHILPADHRHVIPTPKEGPNIYITGSGQGSTDTGPTLSTSGSSDGESVPTVGGPTVSTDAEAEANANAGGGTVITADEDTNVSIDSESTDGSQDAQAGGDVHEVHEGPDEDANASSGHDSGTGHKGDGDGHGHDAHKGKHGHGGHKHGHGSHDHVHPSHGFDFFWHKPMFGHKLDKLFPGHMHGHGHHR